MTLRTPLASGLRGGLTENFRRHAAHHGAFGDILRHHGSGGHGGAVPDRHAGILPDPIQTFLPTRTGAMW